MARGGGGGRLLHSAIDFVLHCAGCAEFLMGGAQGAPGLGFACLCPWPCPPLCSHTSTCIEVCNRGVQGVFMTEGSWVGKHCAVPWGCLISATVSDRPVVGCAAC